MKYYNANSLLILTKITQNMLVIALTRKSKGLSHMVFNSTCTSSRCLQLLHYVS